MENTMLIEITNEKARGLIRELEALQLIRVLESRETHPPQQKRSEKYRGVFTKEDADSFDKHTRQMRDEWDNT